MKKLLLLPILPFLLIANDFFQILPYKNTEFSPKLGEKFTIPIQLKKDGNLTVTILTPDNNPIRTFNLGYRKKGKHSVVWDGKDKWGDIVPDEAYTLKVTLQTKNSIYSINYRTTGGKILHNLNKSVDKFGHIYYFLPQPSRVSVRVGVPNGPLLDILSNWEPKSKGEIRQNWSFINSDKIDFHNAPFAVAISAFTLPRHSIITKNNFNETYLQYLKKRNLRCNLKNISSQIDENTSPRAFECRKNLKLPKINMYISQDGNQTSYLKNDKAVIVHIDMPQEDANLIESKQYEVSFYIDYIFASEAEQGYIPITWRFLPNGLENGRHILTVNITTFDGQVATKSIYFTVQ